MTAKQGFQKTWTFRNAGIESIPARTLKLNFDSGHQFGLQNGVLTTDLQVIEDAVKPGAPFRVIVDFMAPDVAGHYSA